MSKHVIVSATSDRVFMLKMFPLRICRICEKQSNLIDISMNSNYIEQYLMVGGNVSFEIDDGLPQFLCRFCITQLLHFAKFTQKCNETYKKFQDLLMQPKIEATETELNDNETDNQNYDDGEISVYSEYTKTETSNESLSILETTPLDNKNDENAVLSYLNRKNSVDSEKTIEKPHLKGICLENFSKLNNKNDLQLQCQICGTRKFHSMSRLECHMNKVHSMQKNIRKVHSKPYKCEQCYRILASKISLVGHMRSHTGEKPFKCQICERCFSLKETLKRHTKRHTGEKPYKCEQCHKFLATKKTLVQHAQIHNTEKSYQCDYCEKSTFSRDRIISHMKKHHSGKKPFKCQICQKYFSLRETFARHTRKHTDGKPYKCEHCSITFAKKEYLVSHLRTHTGLKPYKCQVCDTRFSHRCTLVRHTRTHTGEKPYKCEICDKRFTQGYTLVKHTKTHKK